MSIAAVSQQINLTNDSVVKAIDAIQRGTNDRDRLIGKVKFNFKLLISTRNEFNGIMDKNPQVKEKYKYILREIDNVLNMYRSIMIGLDPNGADKEAAEKYNKVLPQLEFLQHMLNTVKVQINALQQPATGGYRKRTHRKRCNRKHRTCTYRKRSHRNRTHRTRK